MNAALRFAKASVLASLLLTTIIGVNNAYSLSNAPSTNVTPATYSVNLWDGSQIISKFSSNSLPLKTSSTNITLPTLSISSVNFTNTNTFGILTEANGTALSVKFASSNIPIKTSFGNISMPSLLIRSIEEDDLTNSLLSFWNFNGTNSNKYVPNAGSLTNALQTGNDGRGPVNPGSVVKGKFGNSIGFGTNGNQGLYIPSGEFPILTTFTMTAWVKLNYTTASQNYSIIADSWDGSYPWGTQPGWNFFFGTYNGNLTGIVGLGGTYWPNNTIVTDTQVSLLDKQWHFCVFQCSDNNFIRVKVDNGPWFSLSISGSLAGAAPKPFQVGQNIAQSLYNSNCSIDMLGVWNRVLTDTEISNLYNEGNGLEYPFYQ